MRICVLVFMATLMVAGVAQGQCVLGGGEVVHAYAHADRFSTVVAGATYGPGYTVWLQASASASADWNLAPGWTATWTCEYGAWETCSLNNWTSSPNTDTVTLVRTGLTGNGQAGPVGAWADFHRILYPEDAGPDPVVGRTYTFFTNGYATSYIRCPEILDSYAEAVPEPLQGYFRVIAAIAPPGGGPGGE